VLGGVMPFTAQESINGEDKERLRLANDVHQDARKLEKTGDYRKAAEHFEKSRATRVSLGFEESSWTLAAANGIALAWAKIGDRAKAEAAHESAVAAHLRVRGATHPETLQAQFRFADFLRLQKLTDAFRKRIDEPWAASKKQHGDKHPETAAVLHAIGVYLNSADRRDLARQYLEEALAIREKALGDHLDTAATHHALALALEPKTEDLQKARTHYEKSLAMRVKLRGEEDVLVAESCRYLGRMAGATKRPTESLRYLERALLISESLYGRDHALTAQSTRDLGWFHNGQGDLIKARPFFEQAVAINRKVYGESDLRTANELGELGDFLVEFGDYVLARDCLLQSLAIVQKKFGDSAARTALEHHSLGLAFWRMGEFPGAIEHFQVAAKLFERNFGIDHEQTAWAINGIGLVSQDFGDFVEARKHYEKALEIFRNLKMEWNAATALNNIGWLLQNAGEYAEALEFHRQAFAIFDKLGSPDAINRAMSLHNLGFTLRQLGQFEEARRHLEEALRIRSKVLGENHRQTAFVLDALAGLLQTQGDLEGARRVYERSIEIYRKTVGLDHHETGVALSHHAGLLQSLGDLEGARTLAAQALNNARRNLDLAAGVQSERQQLAMAQAFRKRLDQFVSIPGVPAADVYPYVFGWKGSVFARQQRFRIERSDPKLSELVRQLQATSAELANLAFAGVEPSNRAARTAQLEKITLRIEELERELSVKSAQFRHEEKARNQSLDDLRAAIPADAALIDYLEYDHSSVDSEHRGRFRKERRLLAFVVRSKQEVTRYDLGPTAAIADSVDAWRKAVLRKSQARDEGERLRRLILDPLAKDLEGARLLLVAPDGILGTLPFAALPGRKSDFLLEETTLAVVPLPRLIPAMTPATGLTESLLLVGDVDYGADPGKSEPAQKIEIAANRAAVRSATRNLTFAQLEGTRGEILAVRDSFEKRFRKGRATLLREDEATKAAFRREASEHRWIHVATHGFFAPPEIQSAIDSAKTGFGKDGLVGFHPGLLSGVALAGANLTPKEGQDDGILTALEVAELDLRKTEFVVLSACETGLGKVAGGEGLLGIQRAFQIAGTGTVAATLWSIDDSATRLLMERFYENLWKSKMPKAEALRQAQLYMLREGPRRGIVRLDGPQPPRIAPPYYWASFVLSGDWR
jgi:CHAT domain-containing protein/Tfp pilus assembly protein PilF